MKIVVRITEHPRSYFGWWAYATSGDCIESKPSMLGSFELSEDAVDDALRWADEKGHVIQWIEHMWPGRIR